MNKKVFSLLVVSMLFLMLGSLIVASIGAGIVFAKQAEDANQAGKSPIYKFNVKMLGGENIGKLIVDTEHQTFVFNGKGPIPERKYFLISTLTWRCLGSAYANKAGNIHMNGTLNPSVGYPTEKNEFILSNSPPGGAGNPPSTRLEISVRSNDDIGTVDTTAYIYAYLYEWIWDTSTNSYIWVPVRWAWVTFWHTWDPWNPLPEYPSWWSTCGSALTDANGLAIFPFVISSEYLGYNGFSASHELGDGLGYSRSNNEFVHTRMPVHIDTTGMNPYYHNDMPIEKVYDMTLFTFLIDRDVSVYGYILDKYGNPVPGTVDIIHFRTGEYIDTVEIGNDGYFRWAADWPLDVLPPLIGVVYYANSMYFGLGPANAEYLYYFNGMLHTIDPWEIPD